MSCRTTDVMDTSPRRLVSRQELTSTVSRFFFPSLIVLMIHPTFPRQGAFNWHSKGFSPFEWSKTRTTVYLISLTRRIQMARRRIFHASRAKHELRSGKKKVVSACLGAKGRKQVIADSVQAFWFGVWEKISIYYGFWIRIKERFS